MAGLWQHGSRQGTHCTQWHGIWYLGASLVVSGSLGSSFRSFFAFLVGNNLSQFEILSVFRGFLRIGVSDFKLTSFFADFLFVDFFVTTGDSWLVDSLDTRLLTANLDSDGATDLIGSIGTTFINSSSTFVLLCLWTL